MTEDKKITLRDYQETAIIKFENNGRSGILDMATGTGKTVTSLYAAKRHFEEKQRQFLIVIVPFLHLIDQWAKDFFNFDINYYLEIAYSKNSWVN
ncbi:MAG: DEAD/DEAH box helicase family protein [Atopostipes sp.]|nr:DEAD/DEAH box helicase family protein [Atopostipes sp.]